MKILTGYSSHTITRVVEKMKTKIIYNIEEIKIGGNNVGYRVMKVNLEREKQPMPSMLKACGSCGVEITTERRFFAVVVEKRDSLTLKRLILEYILPSSIVITDGWKGYNLFKETVVFIITLLIIR
jgi:hypothetical protein